LGLTGRPLPYAPGDGIQTKSAPVVFDLVASRVNGVVRADASRILLADACAMVVGMAVVHARVISDPNDGCARVRPGDKRGEPCDLRIGGAQP